MYTLCSQYLNQDVDYIDQSRKSSCVQHPLPLLLESTAVRIPIITDQLPAVEFHMDSCIWLFLLSVMFLRPILFFSPSVTVLCSFLLLNSIPLYG